MWLIITILSLVTLQRMIELAIAHRNTRRLIALGGFEIGSGRYGFVVALQILWLVGLWYLALYRMPQLSMPWIYAYVVLEAARGWIVAGLGNIYVCEALFRAGIDPRKAAGQVSGPALARLVPAIKAVIAEAIEAGGSTLRDYAQPDGQLGYFSKQFDVYDRTGQPCTRCGAPVQRFAQGGRSTWHCAKCQR